MKLIHKILLGLGAVIITALIIYIFVLNAKISKLGEQADKQLQEQYNTLQVEFEEIQRERDSLFVLSGLWNIEKKSYLDSIKIKDSLWNVKANSYASYKNTIVRDGTVVDIAGFLTNR